jgi:hypothetical protein
MSRLLPTDPNLAKLQIFYGRAAAEHKTAAKAELEARHKEDQVRQELYDCIRDLGYCPHCEARLSDCFGHGEVSLAASPASAV